MKKKTVVTIFLRCAVPVRARGVPKARH